MFESISQKSEYSEDSAIKPIKHRKKWEFEETKKYYEFLLVYRNILEQTEKKQKQRIYNKMSDHVGSRSTHQCRSHHQKVMKRYSSIDNFIASFSAKLSSIASKDATKLEECGTNQKKQFTNRINKTKKPEQSPDMVQIFIDEQQQSIKRLFQKQKTLENIRSSQETLKKENELYRCQNYDFKEYSDKNHLPNSSLHQKKGELSIIGNNQMNGNCVLDERGLRNAISQQRFFAEQSSCYRDHDSCLPHDYCRLPQQLQSMAQKTEDSNHQTILYKIASKNKKRQQQFLNIPSCISTQIIQNDNLNLINPQIGHKNIKPKNKQIQKPDKKQQNYKMWFQSRKSHALEGNDEESDSEEIQMAMIREVTIKVLKEFGLIEEKDMLNQKLQNTPDVNLKPIKIQLSKPVYQSNQPKKQKNTPFPPPASESSKTGLFPDPIPVSCKNDLEDRRRTDVQYQSPLIDSNEKELYDLKMENQQKYFEKIIDPFFCQQILFSERQNWQEFPPGYKTPTNFENIPQFQEPNRSSHFGRFYFYEHQTPISPGNLPTCNNPDCPYGCNTGYVQRNPYSNQHHYQPFIPHDGPHYNFQRHQQNSNFPQRERHN